MPLALLLMLAGFLLPGQTLRFPMLGPAKKTLVLRQELTFTIRKYEPRMQIVFQKHRGNAVYESPEGAVIAFISAIASSDANWLNEASGDLSFASETHQEAVSDLVGRADVFRSAKTIELTHRIDDSEGVLIVARFETPEYGSLTSHYSIEFVGGRWRVRSISPVHQAIRNNYRSFDGSTHWCPN